MKRKKNSLHSYSIRLMHAKYAIDWIASLEEEKIKYLVLIFQL